MDKNNGLTNLTILLYHSVVVNDTGHVGPASCLDEFKAHLDFLQSNFSIPKIKTFTDALSFQSQSNSPAIVLTFDDCLKSSLEIIVAELSARNLTAILFPLCQESEDDYCHPIFLAQHLIPKIGWKSFSRALPLHSALIHSTKKYFLKDSISDYKLFSKWSQSMSIRQLSSLSVRIRRHHASLFKGRLFPDTKEIIGLKKSGFMIGSHSCSHAALSRLTKKQEEFELSKSADMLRTWAAKDDSERLFSYPFGAFSNGTVSSIKKNGFTTAFTTVSRTFQAGTNLFLVPRIAVDSLSVSELSVLLKKKIE